MMLLLFKFNYYCLNYKEIKEITELLYQNIIDNHPEYLPTFV